MEIELSIVIPCYNHGSFIREALDSIPLDAFPNTEIIIVNDGSTDANTIEVLEQLSAQGYTVINQANQGLGRTRNNGIRLAKGKYILPLDADNKLLPTYLTKGVQFLNEHPEFSVVYGDPILFGDEQGHQTLREFNLQQLITGNYIDACALFRKSAWEAVGGYDEHMPYMGVEDWEFWLNLSFNGHRFYYLPEPCYYYRVANKSMIKKDTAPNYSVLRFYIEKKHSSYLDFNAPAEALALKFKANPFVLIFKLTLASYFPKIYKEWVEQRKIKRI
jgi:glycosyltransferase involved in cell wall biosynthesis